LETGEKKVSSQHNKRRGTLSKIDRKKKEEKVPRDGSPLTGAKNGEKVEKEKLDHLGKGGSGDESIGRQARALGVGRDEIGRVRGYFKLGKTKGRTFPGAPPRKKGRLRCQQNRLMNFNRRSFRREKNRRAKKKKKKKSCDWSRTIHVTVGKSPSLG